MWGREASCRNCLCGFRQAVADSSPVFLWDPSPPLGWSIMILTGLQRAFSSNPCLSKSVGAGGSAKYVLAGSVEVGEGVGGKLGLLVFTRTVDVESKVP
jgi:hypothetical protein